MADPFAPPESRPRTRSDPFAAPPATASHSYPATTATASPAASTHAGPRSEAANPGIFWMVAAIGIALLAVARLLGFFLVIDEMESEDVAPGLFAVLGIILLSMGLTAAAVMQRGLAMTWRIALILGGGYFAVSGTGFMFLARLGAFFP